MRVLSVYYTHKPGGFCKRLYRLLNALAHDGYEVHFLALDKPPATLSASVHFHKIPFLIKSRCSLLFWSVFTLWCPLYLLLFSFRFSIQRIIVFGAYYSCVSQLASLVLSPPILLFLRSLPFKTNKTNGVHVILRTLSNLIEYIGTRGATKIICMSNAMQSDLERFMGRKLNNCAILPNDLPTMPSRQWEEKNTELLTLLAVAVVDRRKNLLFLLKAWQRLQLNHWGAPLILKIAGDGPQLNELKDFVSKENIGNVIFLGWVEDVPALLAESDLLVHPSLHEGTPNAILEALALNRPVLASDIPELREILRDDSLLFDPYDEGALEAKLAQLVKKPSQLEEWRILSYKNTERLRFDWDNAALSLIK